VVPVSVIDQRLSDEAGLQASVASVRRYVAAHFPEAQRAGEVEIPRPPVDPGDEGQIDYCYLGTWFDPVSVGPDGVGLRHGGVVLPAPVRPPRGEHGPARLGGGPCGRLLVLPGLPQACRTRQPQDRRLEARPLRSKLNRAYGELANHYRLLVDPARARKPKDKPRSEAIQRFIRTSFFVGRDWPSLSAIVADATRWCTEVAGRRTPRALEGRTPLEVFAAEEAGALLPLPATPFELASWSRPKVAPDAHARVGRTLYSLPYRLIGCHLDARATRQVVQFFLDGELVKTHPYQSCTPVAPGGTTMTPTWHLPLRYRCPLPPTRQLPPLCGSRRAAEPVGWLTTR
jgi:hypothetical protein